MDRRLTDYLPDILKPVRELKAACAGQQGALEQVWAAAEAALDDQFIRDAAEHGIARRERLLGILPKGTDTLEDRRFRVRARMNETLPYTLPALREMLAALCGDEGYTAELGRGDYTLTVRVALAAKSNYGDVAELLERVTPVNLAIDLSLMYNRHETLSRFTHAQLAAHTYEELRNEVLRS